MFLFDRARIYSESPERRTPSIDDLYEISGNEARELFPPLALSTVPCITATLRG
jgi:hypothetical protein